MSQQHHSSCGCCRGTEILTPEKIVNRPGLNQLSYRAGTHATFLETMKARLSSFKLENHQSRADSGSRLDGDNPLGKLSVRESDDPAIAMLDAWATVGEVLTFYQERIANEGYLRTATERRSITDLVRLTGYTMRPGVSASTFLALTLEKNFSAVLKPNELKAQSVPGPGELPQIFENSEELDARGEWNILNPRKSKPQNLSCSSDVIYFKGVSTNLQINDPLLLVGINYTLYRVTQIILDAQAESTKVMVMNWSGASTQAPSLSQKGDSAPRFNDLITGLIRPASVPPRNSLQLTRTFNKVLKAGADTGLQLISTFQPNLRGRLQNALRRGLSSNSTSSSNVKVYALRVKAAPFGHNAPLRTSIPASGGQVQFQEWTLDKNDIHSNSKLSLDNEYKVQSGSWIAIVKGDQTHFKTVTKVENSSIAAFGISGKSTVVTFENINDINDIIDNSNSLSTVRSIIVYAQNEELELADEPLDDDVTGDEIELDGLYSELKSGRWLIISGERTDIKENSATVTSIMGTELVMLDNVEHKVLPDYQYTCITFAKRLEYSYKRDTVKIYANVVKADHGETRKEILGSGDSTKEFQGFPLRQPPLTYVAATTPDGTDSTLRVMVNDIQWRESETLAELSSSDRKFITRTDDEGNTTIIFGNGKNGARLPSGAENIRATYRSGIGAAGNVKADQISQLMAKPLGVKEVINPFGATGGADKESRDLARRNAPLSVTALDRLVSTQDYADFASTFAGIGKSNAVRLTDGAREIVHLTIAGADDILIDESSDLFQSLNKALRQFGDPYQPFKVQVREKLILIISGKVRILPDYMWESVVTNIRKTLLDKFSFHRRELGEDVFLSEVISTIQSVGGVAYVDIDVFGGVSEKIVDRKQRRQQTPSEILSMVSGFRPTPRVAVNLAAFEGGVVRPAQLAYLAPEVPDTLILNQI